ncbi:MAG TPA: polysaccharide deacetylase family protein [Caulobacteraceae bacterium]
MQGADRSWKGKLRRRIARLEARRAAPGSPPGPMVSFSFDDVPESAAGAGAEILERRGAKGTYFIAMGLAGQDGPMGRNIDAAEIRRLSGAGHEIGCHTYSHLSCGQAPPGLTTGDVERNRKALEALGVPDPVSFAYPYGEVSSRAKTALGGRYGLLRALHHGLIRKGCDLNQAPAVGIEGPGGEAVARRWLHRALTERAWLILYSHDVRPDPSPYGCTPETLARLVDEALEGGAEVVTVAEGCRRIGALG